MLLSCLQTTDNGWCFLVDSNVGQYHETFELITGVWTTSSIETQSRRMR